MMKQLFSILLFLFCLSHATASEQTFGQLYVADHLIQDSINLTPTEASASSLKVCNGDTLRLAGMDSKRPIVEYRGNRYYAMPNSLMFVADNEAGDGNVAQSENTARYHSALGHFFYTPVPLIFILAVLLVSGLLFIYLGKTDELRKAIPWLYSIMALMLVASVSEFLVIVFTGDVTWWCESDSFWVSLLCLFPAMLALGIQLYLGFGIKGKLEELTSSSLSFKTALISIPAAAIITLIVAIMHYSGTVQAIAFLGVLGASVLYSWFKNGRGLGFVAGLAYTLFNYVYVIGALIAVVVLIAIVWNMFLIVLPYLIMGAAIVFLVAFAGSMGSSSGSTSVSNTSKDQWTCIDGQWGTKHSDGTFTTGGDTYKQDMTGSWVKK